MAGWARKAKDPDSLAGGEDLYPAGLRQTRNQPPLGYAGTTRTRAASQNQATRRRQYGQSRAQSPSRLRNRETLWHKSFREPLLSLSGGRFLPRSPEPRRRRTPRGCKASREVLHFHFRWERGFQTAA